MLEPERVPTLEATLLGDLGTRTDRGGGPRLALLMVLGLLLALGGCSSKSPAPVYGWDWSGPVPPGFYLVRRGDSLSLIAQRRGVSVRTLARWNRLKPPYTIYAQTLLRVAPPDGSQPKRTAGAPAPASSRPKARKVSSQRGGREAAARATAATATPKLVSEGAGSRRGPSGIPWQWPLDGSLVQRFRPGDPTRQGIRIGGRAGEQVRASADGQVVYSGSGLKAYGNLIIIKHNDKYLSAYGFNRRLFVTEGDGVQRGQVVAEVGQGVEGTYLLHFEVRRHGTAVDPVLYLPPRN